MSINKDVCFLIIGHGDTVERSLISYLRAQGFGRVLSSTELGLNVLSRIDVDSFLKENQPDYIILGSVRSGGIKANQEQPAEFIHENLLSQVNVIDGAYRAGVKKLLFLGASCVYPKECTQPMSEDVFLTGSMEKTSEPYSLAKAVGIVICQSYRRQYGFNAIVAIPATAYGVEKAEEFESAHVMGALIGKFYKAVQEKAPSLTLWGTGTPCREFIYGDDLASACLFLLENYEDEGLINIGTGKDISIKGLAEAIKNVSGFQGAIDWDITKPDGTMRKLLDSSRIEVLGWTPQVSLEEGIKKAYQGYKNKI